LLLLLLSTGQLMAQKYGCTDPKASNFNPDATINDGSCIYPKTNINPDSWSKKLPEILEENSGMIFFNNLIWFLNDSGQKPELYGYDTSQHQIVRTVYLTGAYNNDWEALTHDNNYIYIGDFGNNYGNRKNLKILRISKTEIANSGTTTVSYDSVIFSYIDQTDFNADLQNHDFDCEAFIVINDTFYLFSKNWKNQQTKIYSLPALPGNYMAKIESSWNVDGLITDACISPSKNAVVLLGYKNYQPFLWLLFDYRSNQFFTGNKRRIDMPSILLFQTEAAYFQNNSTLIFSSEKSPAMPNRLFKLNTSQWTGNLNFIKNENEPDKVFVYPNPCRDEFSINIPEYAKGQYFLKLSDSNGKTVLFLKNVDFNKKKTEKIKLKNINPGVYLIHLQSDKHYFTASLVVVNDN